MLFRGETRTENQEFNGGQQRVIRAAYGRDRNTIYVIFAIIAKIVLLAIGEIIEGESRKRSPRKFKTF